ncbi:hypothetical protein Tco_0019999 [Tanacetum coccineum]
MMNPIAVRKKIICLLAKFLHKKQAPLSRPQEVEGIKIKEDKVSSDVLINTIVMPIRITFDNPIDFNDHFAKPKDFKKDLPISFDSTTTSTLPPPLLDFDSPFTAELSASENLKENISSGTLLVFKEPSFLLPPPEPPDECLNFEPILVMKNVVLNEDFYQSKKTLPLNVEDVNSFAFVIWTFLPYFTYTEESPLIFSFRSMDKTKITRKQSKTGKHGHENRKSTKEAKDAKPKPEKVNLQERLVKSSFSLTHSQAKATWLWKKAQGELGFTLGSLREVTQGSHQGLPAWQSV